MQSFKNADDVWATLWPVVTNLLSEVSLMHTKVAELERRLEFFNGHTHSVHTGSMMGVIIGAPEPRRDI